MKPLRVLVTTTALGGGGAESHAVRVVNHLDRTRFAPAMAVVRRGGAYEPWLAPDVPVYDVGRGPRGTSTARALLGAPTLGALLDTGRFDVVVPLLDAPIEAAALACARRDVALVPSLQIPPGVQHGARAVDRLVRLPALGLALRRADRVVALSHGVADDARATFPFLSDRIDVVHNACVDDTTRAAARRAPDGALPKGPFLVACGRLTPQKDYPTMLRAFARVGSGAGTPPELLVLGDGEDRAALEALARALGIASRVRFLGFVDAPQRWFSRATGFVLSSRYEGFGNVVAEALSCGAQVVSTDCPHGPREILGDGAYGALVPVGDVPALASAMQRMLERHPAERARLAEAARAGAARFEARTIAEAYGAVLLDAVARRRGR